jgi:mannose-1-phosphate guanylyltransferase
MHSERQVDVLDREERAPGVQAQTLRRGEDSGEGRAPWVVVLAGGDGRRLLGLTRDAHGESIPKQFYRFRDARSLLGETLGRARALTPDSRILVVVVEAHRRWWEAELAGLDPRNILVQPANRGTAIAILLGWAQVRSRDAHSRLVFMPSDHEVDDADRLVAAMGDALARTAAHAESLVFLGMTPRETDGEYGFLVPGAGRMSAARAVVRFVEKPARAAVAALVSEGALWNTFIFACRGEALERAFRESFPVLTHDALRRLAMVRGDLGALRRFFAELPVLDFSQDLLQAQPWRVRALVAPECGWTDLGTPRRLAAWLATHRGAAYLKGRRPGEFGGSYQPGVPSG